MESAQLLRGVLDLAVLSVVAGTTAMATTSYEACARLGSTTWGSVYGALRRL
jgi:membrane protein DedA with SNARE-associated domain